MANKPSTLTPNKILYINTALNYNRNMLTKIIHCDADCFFAAVEMRDNPYLRGIPIAVGGSSEGRGVISACNYEARRFGVHSAMSSAYAMRICPELTLVDHHFEKYREASAIMQKIFHDYTDLVEPLSLDEAYLDVSLSCKQQGDAIAIATEIRQRIHKQVGITASAGVAPCKFLAKIASDWNKPNGLFVIEPEQVDDFIKDLPVSKIHGVGKVTLKKLTAYGITNCYDLSNFGLDNLNQHFGSFGQRLFNLSQGIDHRKVTPHRVRKSVSVEHTYPSDIHNADNCLQQIPDLIDRLQNRLDKLDEKPHIIKAFVKVKFSDFTSTTLERIGTTAQLKDYKELMSEALQRKDKAVRLLGLGVRLGFEETSIAEVKSLSSQQYELF